MKAGGCSTASTLTPTFARAGERVAPSFRTREMDGAWVLLMAWLISPSAVVVGATVRSSGTDWVIFFCDITATGTSSGDAIRLWGCEEEGVREGRD